VALTIVGWLWSVPPAVLGEEASPQLAELLERVPAADAEAGTTWARQLVAVGPEALGALGDMLVAPGTGDDTKARMALHGVAFYVGAPGRDAERTLFVTALLSKLQSATVPQVREFLLEQLHLAVGADAVGALGGYLTNPELCEPATQALLAVVGGQPQIRSDVLRTFRAALPAARGAQRVTVIRGLGVLHDTESVEALLPDARSEDLTLRQTACFALAHSGNARAEVVLREAVAKESGQARDRACDLLVEYARGRAARGDKEPAATLLRELLKSEDGPGGLHGRCAALSALVEVLGLGALDEVIAAAADENPVFAATAGRLLIDLPGEDATQALVARLGASTPQVRVVLLNVLGRRGDRSGAVAVLAALKDTDAAVRQAAMPAAAALAQELAVPSLVRALDANTPAERDAAQAALAQIPGDFAVRVMAGAMTQASPRARSVLLTVLAGRPGQTPPAVFLKAARDSEVSVRVTALNALEALAGPEATPLLLSGVGATTDAAETEALERALAAACRRIGGSEQRSYPIIEALMQQGVSATRTCSLLRVLGRMGGPEALAAVRWALDREDAAVAETAFAALCDWPDAGAAEALLTLARQRDDLKQHVRALQGYVRVVGLAKDRPIGTTLKVYMEGLAAARRVEEKRLVLAALGQLRDRETLAVLEPLLGDPDLKAEAAAAVVTVAEALVSTSWEGLRVPLEKALAANPAKATRERAQAVFDRVAAYEDHITAWEVAGPYSEPGKAGTEVFDTIFAPETGAAAGVTWKPQPLCSGADRAWRVDLHAHLPGDNQAAYLRTHVFSPKAQEAMLEVGSDDGIKVWLNGAVVHANNALRGVQPGADKVRVSLQEGWNTLLLKVTNNGGAWNACARFRTVDGGHLEGVYAQVNPSGDAAAASAGRSSQP